jgi:hypothetical protein
VAIGAEECVGHKNMSAGPDKKAGSFKNAPVKFILLLK